MPRCLFKAIIAVIFFYYSWF